MADRTRALGRAAAVIAGASATTHVLLAVDAMERSRVTAVFLVAMAAACLGCTPRLLRGGDLQAWMTMLGLTGGLLVVHAQLCFDCGPTMHGQAAGFLDHLTGSGAASAVGSLALWLMLAEIVLTSVGALSFLTHPAPRAAALGRPAIPNRR